MQIVVLGMYGAGLSMVTRLVAMMGAYVAPEDRIAGINKYNPKGSWDRKDVLHINDALLALHGCTWEWPVEWPRDWPERPVPADPALHAAMRQVVMGLDTQRPWVLKDPRLCLALPYWRPLLEMPLAVIVHRDPLELAYTLAARYPITPAAALALWEHHAVHLLNSALRMPRVFVEHGRILRQPAIFVRALHEMLAEQYDVRGLRLPSDKEVGAFMDDTLRASYAVEKGSGLELTPFQRHVADIMAQNTPHQAVLTVSAASMLTLRNWRGSIH